MGKISGPSQCKKKKKIEYANIFLYYHKTNHHINSSSTSQAILTICCKWTLLDHLYSIMIVFHSIEFPPLHRSINNKCNYPTLFRLAWNIQVDGMPPTNRGIYFCSMQTWQHLYANGQTSRSLEGMKTSSHGNAFCITGYFVRGIHQWLVDSPHKVASNLQHHCFLCY